MRASAHEVGIPVYLPLDIPGGSAEIKMPKRLTEAEFYQFCADNPDLRIEQDKNGKIIIMPPVDFDGGAREGHVFGLLYSWWIASQKGLTLSPTTGFKLPDGSTRSADGAWVSDEKIAALAPAERKKFARVVPDFVIEVRSTSDRLAPLKRKMSDAWIKNGVRLAWLIDPVSEKAWVYRADGLVSEVNGFDHSLSGEDVCPGFELDLSKLKL